MAYLSGWEALNIPRLDGTTADWHPLLYFADKNSVKTYESNEILGDLGIQKRYIKILDKEEYVASYARAIADLVYSGDIDGLKNCVRDYLDEDEEIELFGYLKLINKSHMVDDFMKFELTKLYFKDKKC